MRDKDAATPLSEEIAGLGIIENIARRHFLMGLSATLLAGCGGDSENAFAEGVRAAPASSGQPSGAVPVSNGSEGGTPSTGAARIRTFSHPGLLHTEADFARMRAKVGAHASPWIDSWNLLFSNFHTRLTSIPNPQPEIRRGGSNENYWILYGDIAFAYGHALCWRVSGDKRHGDKAVEYLDRWSSTLTALGGNSNVALAAGIYGYEFANVGEMMRGYDGWSAGGLAAFQKMMLDVFHPINHGFLHRPVDRQRTHYWANWELCNLASMLAIGVLCDNADIVDDAVSYFKNGAGNGSIGMAVYFVHPGYLGQWQEAGRDQGHTQLGIALTGAICEMAWNQGIDLYGYDNNRFLAGAEYVAKSNLKQADGSFFPVPFATYQNVDVTQTAFATGSQGGGRPCWALVANHYINRKGLAAPYTQRFAEFVAPEGGGGNYGSASGGYDQLGYGTLTCTRDPGAPAPTPSGLTGYASADKVVLSWWGCSNASGYNVKRATIAGGPYTTLRTGVTDWLTHTDTPPGPGTYFYVVTAQTPAGESAATNEVKVATSTLLLAHLTFDEGSGLTAADRSGNGHHGTLNGATWAPGRRTHAVSLNGAGAYVELAGEILSDVADFTISVWVYWNDRGQSWAPILDLSGRFGSYVTLMPRTDWRTDNQSMRFAIAVNGFGDQMVDAPTMPDKQWVHVAVTLAGPTATLYMNGKPVAGNTGMFLAPFRLGGLTHNWLGKSQYPVSTFNGLLEDLRIYRGALGDAQIVALMNG
ncbi:LamG-like jellyroll fold domain-containing protein [Burkholderia seminalis]|uniref:LamG-like jellyroll fold domain-containing protein n=1 Tax=Burkholderia seminalis TaxID=488731 RepID=UPI00264E47C1|nr:LamG-like jellyroll fold domain-containing protein [Burkholderia seminalis]MDN7853502.1 alginate lyase family protein [Burkholderia seminalis]